MFKIICVTNRKLCSDFESRVQKLYECGVDVILREKDLTPPEYEKLAEKILRLCPNVILHTHCEAAKRLGVNRIHLPFSMMNKHLCDDFETIGVSVHSAKEAAIVQKLGASYVTAGHVFETDCKKGLAPRGIEFLKSVMNAVKIPVYAIGGISPENIEHVRKSGALGACVMSGFMRCENVEKYLENLLKK